MCVEIVKCRVGGGKSCGTTTNTFLERYDGCGIGGSTEGAKLLYEAKIREGRRYISRPGRLYCGVSAICTRQR